MSYERVPTSDHAIDAANSFINSPLHITLSVSSGSPTSPSNPSSSKSSSPATTTSLSPVEEGDIGRLIKLVGFSEQQMKNLKDSNDKQLPESSSESIIKSSSPTNLIPSSYPESTGIIDGEGRPIIDIIDSKNEGVKKKKKKLPLKIFMMHRSIYIGAI